MKIILINDNALQKICAIDCHQKEDKMSIEINLQPYKLAPLDYTVAVSRLQSFSAYSETRKTRPSYPPPPHRGHNRHRSKSAKTTLVPRIPQHNIIYRDYVKRLLYKNAKVRPSKDALSGRPALSYLEIAPSSQLTFEERGIGHSAGRRSRPAQ